MFCARGAGLPSGDEFGDVKGDCDGEAEAEAVVDSGCAICPLPAPAACIGGDGRVWKDSSGDTMYTADGSQQVSLERKLMVALPCNRCRNSCLSQSLLCNFQHLLFN